MERIRDDTMKKKLIGLALSAAMLFSVLSVPAFAAAPEENADPALTTEQTAAEEENCFFTSSSTEEEKEPNSITYVALGDSICAGIGLTTVQYATFPVWMFPSNSRATPRPAMWVRWAKA